MHLPARPHLPFCIARPLPRRAFASSSSKPAPTWRSFTSNLTLSSLRQYLPQLAGVTAGIVILYGVSDIIYWITTTILGLDMYDVFYYGFYTGSACVLLLSTTSFALYRRARIQPERAVKLALAKVQRSGAVAGLLGGNVKQGALTATSRSIGHVSVSKSRRLAWVEPRAQFLFQVVGDAGDGFVSGEAVKHNGRTVLSLLALDTRDSTILLVGEEEKLSVKGSLRGFLQVQRAQYIEQSTQEDDDARVEEQADLPDDGSDTVKPHVATGAAKR